MGSIQEVVAHSLHPPQSPPRQILATVLEHTEVAPAHYKMQLAAATIAKNARAGQFVHVLARSVTVRDPLLRRAFSIMQCDDESITILYRVMGQGTAWLSSLGVGMNVDLIGPLGKPFSPLSRQAILVGGGVGVPPLVMLASTRKTQSGNASLPLANQELTAIIGARSRHDLIGIQELTEMGIPVEVSTDDGSAGHHGRVTDLLKIQLEAKRHSNLTVYSCGPFAMLKAVSDLCRAFNVPCQVSLEENMPCGVGICNGCVVPVVGAGDDYGRYRRICVEGSVVWADEIDWDHLSAGAACY